MEYKLLVKEKIEKQFDLFKFIEGEQLEVHGKYILSIIDFAGELQLLGKEDVENYLARLQNVCSLFQHSNGISKDTLLSALDDPLKEKLSIAEWKSEIDRIRRANKVSKANKEDEESSKK